MGRRQQNIPAKSVHHVFHMNEEYFDLLVIVLAVQVELDDGTERENRNCRQ